MENDTCTGKWPLTARKLATGGKSVDKLYFTRWHSWHTGTLAQLAHWYSWHTGTLAHWHTGTVGTLAQLAQLAQLAYWHSWHSGTLHISRGHIVHSLLLQCHRLLALLSFTSCPGEFILASFIFLVRLEQNWILSLTV